MQRLIVHVGMPKCGSTSLQLAFNQCTGVLYLGKTRGKFCDDRIGQFVRTVAPFGDVRLINAQPYRHAFGDVFAQSEHSTAILSDEILSSIGFATHGHSNSFPQIIENFRRVVGVPLEVVIVVREQRAFLRSYYKQWVINDGDLTFDEFVQLVLMRETRFLQPALNYPRIVRIARSMVKHLHVFAFERLFSDPVYRLEKLEQLDAADAAITLDTLHERPSAPDTSLLNVLQSRPPTAWSQNYTGNRRNMYSDLYAYTNMSFPNAKRKSRQLQGIEDRHKQLLSQGRRAFDDVTGDEFLELDVGTEQRLERLIRGFNSKLGSIDPTVDWEQLGYLT